MSISISICYEYQYLYAMSISISTQKFAGRHVDPLDHITLIPSQPVFVLTPQYCVFVREAESTKLIVSGFTQPWYEPHSRQANKSLHYVQMLFPDIERKIGNQISPFLKMFVAR